MSVKLSRKQLKETGEVQDGFYLGGNVYNYENVIFYLQSRDIENMQKQVKGHDMEHLVNYLKHYDMEQVRIFATQMFYSAGSYGNNGQLHRIVMMDKATDKKLDTIYVYYC